MKQITSNVRSAVVLLSFVTVLFAAGCTPELSRDPADYLAPESAGELLLVEIGEEAIPLADGTTRTMVRTPKASGEATFSNTSATIDTSNAAEGYVMVKYTGGTGKIKVQIQKSGGKTYTYDLKSDGSYEVFPLSAGDGKYSISVFKNVSGTSYAKVLDGSINVTLASSTLPFLYPNQYVNFNSGSKTVEKSENLAGNATTDLEIVSKVYNYVVNNISYDKDKAQKAANGQMAGYLPAVDSILASGKGICFDYASVMAAMLRAQQIPARLEVGYVSGGAYHAWISVYTKETGWINGAIQFDGKSWKLMDPTFASSGNQSESIMKYIGNGSNYSVQYYY